jgi:hypothetical protein
VWLLRGAGGARYGVSATRGRLWATLSENGFPADAQSLSKTARMFFFVRRRGRRAEAGERNIAGRKRVLYNCGAGDADCGVNRSFRAMPFFERPRIAGCHGDISRSASRPPGGGVHGRRGYHAALDAG